MTIAFGTDLLGETHVRQNEEFAIRARVLPSPKSCQRHDGRGSLVGMEDKLGVIKPGAIADLLVVDGSPLEDAAILADPAKNIRLVMQGGNIHRRASAMSR